jgi:hypothetical protein
MGNINVVEETGRVNLALLTAQRKKDIQLIRELSVQQFVLNSLVWQETIGKKDYEALCKQETVRRALLTAQTVRVRGTAEGMKALERKVDTKLEKELKRLGAEAAKADAKSAEVDGKVTSLLQQFNALEDVSVELQEMLDEGCTREELEGIFDDGELDMAFKSQEEIETLMKAAEVEMLVDELNALQWKGELAKLQRRLNKLKQA